MLENEPGIRKVVSRVLSSARFQIDWAADGHDLVLLDLMGSGLDGVGRAGLTVKVGRRRSRGTVTPTVKATDGSIAYQATTQLTVK